MPTDDSALLSISWRSLLQATEERLRALKVPRSKRMLLMANNQGWPAGYDTTTHTFWVLPVSLIGYHLKEPNKILRFHRDDLEARHGCR